MINFTKLCSEARIPKRGTSGSVGFDITGVEGKVIPPNSTVTIRTGLKVDGMQAGFYGQLVSRSGLCLKKNLTTLCGVIDPDFRGEIKVILHNLSPTESTRVEKGERISQILFLPFVAPPNLRNRSIRHFRHQGGLGSTDTVENGPKNYYTYKT